MNEAIREQVQELLGFFGYQQLPPHLQMVSMPFHQLAHGVADEQDWSWELVECLRNLLSAKDAVVRAAVLGQRKREEAVIG